MYYAPLMQHNPNSPSLPMYTYHPTGVNHTNTLGFFRPCHHENSIAQSNQIHANPANNPNVVKSAFSKEEAAAIALLLGIDFSKSKFDLNEFWMGVNTELEHGKRSIQTNVTDDNPLITGKIALAHLNEFPDYYKRLKVLEEQAKAYWNK
ncbi:DUF5661 family protein [Sporosarcina koreensis]|uniref:DUF5661 family protein n=1 Tax=Sporosarcina koreensis TaxID=334735 RepID=A0ABW0TUX3_9BACL